MASIRSGSCSPSPICSLPPSFDVRNPGDTLRQAVSRITAERSQEISRFLHGDLVILSSSPIKPRTATPLPSPQNSPYPTYNTDLEPEPEASHLSDIPPELEKDSALFPLLIELRLRRHVIVINVVNRPRYGCYSQVRTAIQLDRYQKDSEGFGGCLTG
jgi:hypothetical protein